MWHFSSKICDTFQQTTGSQNFLLSQIILLSKKSWRKLKAPLVNLTQFVGKIWLLVSCHSPFKGEPFRAWNFLLKKHQYIHQKLCIKKPDSGNFLLKNVHSGQSYGQHETHILDLRPFLIVVLVITHYFFKMIFFLNQIFQCRSFGGYIAEHFDKKMHALKEPLIFRSIVAHIDDLWPCWNFRHIIHIPN